MMANEKTISVGELKDCLDALEKLKAIRRELKAKLNKEGPSDREEVYLAEQLFKMSEKIAHLEDSKLRPVRIPGETSK
jgi:hypothetical protein